MEIRSISRVQSVKDELPDYFLPAPVKHLTLAADI